MYIDTGSSMPISPSKSRDLADENNKFWRNGNDSKQPYWNMLKIILWNYKADQRFNAHKGILDDSAIN